MARNRSLSPDLFTDEKVLQLPFVAVGIYIGLISQADDEGRFEWRPTQLAARIAGMRQDLSLLQFKGHLEEVREAGLVVVYSVNMREYAYHPSWFKHQYVCRRTESKVPLPVGPEHDVYLISRAKKLKGDTSSLVKLTEDSRSSAGVLASSSRSTHLALRDPQVPLESESESESKEDYWRGIEECAPAYLEGSYSVLPDERPAKADLLPGLPSTVSKSAKKRVEESAPSREWESASLPAHVKNTWPAPDDLEGFEKLALTFVAIFGNVKDPAKVAKAKPSFSDALAMMRSKRGATVEHAWKAFQKCRKMRDGRPVNYGEAKLAVSYVAEFIPIQSNGFAKPANTELPGLVVGYLHSPDYDNTKLVPAICRVGKERVGFTTSRPEWIPVNESLAWKEQFVIPKQFSKEQVVGAELMP